MRLSARAQPAWPARGSGAEQSMRANRNTPVALCFLLLLRVASSQTNPPVPAPNPASAKDAASSNAWSSLFDGKSLAGWRITDFAGHGEVRIDNGRLILESGIMTGVTWTNDLPRMHYEISLEAMRVEGSDFFCGLTFPVDKAPCSLIVGGWGGGVVGLSNLDGEDAANNETTQFVRFENNRWYRIRLRVQPDRIQAWIDDDQLVDVVITERRISIRPEVELSVPLGVASWSTTAALRHLRLRRLAEKP